MWRRPAAHDALRGGTCTAYSRRKMVVAEGMGACEWPCDAGCVERSSRSPGVWLSFCTGCGSMVASSGGARTAPRFLRLPEAAAENAGKPPSRRSTRSASAEKCPHGDDGWGEFVAPADPAANLRQRRPIDWASPSFSSHHEAA